MDLRDCQALALAVAARFDDTGDPFRGLARVLEECGEAAAEVARLERSGSKGFYGAQGSRDALADELADVLINLAGLANTYGLELAQAMERKRQRLVHEHGWEALEARPSWAPEAPEAAGRGVAVTVYCSASQLLDATYTEAARVLGRLLAERGYTLVYGGGDLGLMGAVSRAAAEAGGRVEGVIFDRFLDACGDQSHVTELVAVGAMPSRRRGLMDAGDALVALPGGFGTLEELTEALSAKVLGLHACPILILNTSGYYNALLEQLERGFADRFAGRPEGAVLYEVFDAPEALCAALDRAFEREAPNPR